MDPVRILVVTEDAEPSRSLRLTAHRQPVEFEFLPPDAIRNAPELLVPFAAVVSTLDPDSRDLFEGVRAAGGSVPPVLLFPGPLPYPEIARWAAWSRGGEPGNGGLAERLLAESVEYFTLASLYQQCLRILSAPDGESVLGQAADTFTHGLSAENCVLWLASPGDPDDFRIASVRGMIGIGREGSRFSLSRAPWAEEFWKGAPFLLPEPEDPEPGSEASPPASLLVPLLHREHPVGLAKLGPRTDRAPYSGRDLFLARIIGEYAATGWRNASRIQRLEKISLRDSDTRAYSAAFLADYFEKERFRAGRFRRPLSVIFLVAENLSWIVSQTRESLAAASIHDVLEALRKALRDSDLVARLDGNRFCVVLPETDHFGSLLAARRLRKAVREKVRIPHLGNEYLLELFFLPATFPGDGKDLDSLWGTAEERYRRQRSSPWRKLRLEGKTFWSAFDTLVGTAEDHDRLLRGEPVPHFSRIRRDHGRNVHFRLPRETYLRVIESVAQDAASLGGNRGMVLAGGPRPEIYKQIFHSFAKEENGQPSVYVVGPAGSTRFDSRNLLYVAADDDRLRESEFLFLLKEDGSYGLFGSPRGEEFAGFNTSDEVLVGLLIDMAQEEYHLQGIL